MSELMPLSMENSEELKKIGLAIQKESVNELVKPHPLEICTNIDSVLSDLYDEGESPMDKLMNIERNTKKSNMELQTINESLKKQIEYQNDLIQIQKKQLMILSDILKTEGDTYCISKDIDQYITEHHGKEYLKDKAGDAIVNIVVSALTAILRSRGCLF